MLCIILLYYVCIEWSYFKKQQQQSNSTSIDAVSGGVSPRREGAGDKICNMSDTVPLPPLLE